MCARRSGNILFYFSADNFTGSKDTELYKTDVSFLYQYIWRHFVDQQTVNAWRIRPRMPLKLYIVYMSVYMYSAVKI